MKECSNVKSKEYKVVWNNKYYLDQIIFSMSACTYTLQLFSYVHRLLQYEGVSKSKEYKIVGNKKCYSDQLSELHYVHAMK